MIDLEVPRKFAPLVGLAHQAAADVFRPIARKYDLAEHTYPRELDLFATAVDAMRAAGEDVGSADSSPNVGSADSSPNVGSADSSPNVGSADGSPNVGSARGTGAGVRNGSNLSSVLSIIEMCWGDVGLLLSMPRQGLGNAAIAAVGTREQRARFAGTWAAMAITEPGAGSDSAAIATTATPDPDGRHYVLTGEKIFVTGGERADTVVVWATLDRARGRAAIKPFVVPKGTPGLTVVGCEDKLGIRASDTATLHLDRCRVPRENLLGSPEIEDGFAGAMQTFDNTRPMVAAMAVGLARAAIERTAELLAGAGVQVDYHRPADAQHAAAAALLAMEADWESAYLLTLRAAWLADNGEPNSLAASMAKAKAGRTAVDIALRCVELAGSAGYTERELLEKWARDAKILDIFEGTQQIQQLIIARRVLGKTSTELR
jgi:acyl-CoA dehydrogenase